MCNTVYTYIPPNKAILAIYRLAYMQYCLLVILSALERDIYIPPAVIIVLFHRFAMDMSITTLLGGSLHFPIVLVMIVAT